MLNLNVLRGEIFLELYQILRIIKIKKKKLIKVLYMLKGNLLN